MKNPEPKLPGSVGLLAETWSCAGLAGAVPRSAREQVVGDDGLRHDDRDGLRRLVLADLLVAVLVVPDLDPAPHGLVQIVAGKPAAGSADVDVDDAGGDEGDLRESEVGSGKHNFLSTRIDACGRASERHAEKSSSLFPASFLAILARNEAKKCSKYTSNLA